MNVGSAAWFALLAALAGGATFAADADGDAPAPADAAAQQAEPEEASDRGAASEQTEPPPTAAPQPAAEPEPALDAAADAAHSPEVFVPTEDISEDLSVRFPVDI